MTETTLPYHRSRGEHLGYDGIIRRHTATVSGREVFFDAHCECGWVRAKSTKREARESLALHIETGRLDV